MQMTRKDYDNYDYLIGMDSANIRNIKHIAGGDPEEKYTSCWNLQDQIETLQIRGIQVILTKPTGMW